jgi:dTDP-4-dehydrorhamnose 3,5-epimerase
MNQNFNVENAIENGLDFGVKIIRPFVASDERGDFIKDYSTELLLQYGIEHTMKEVFYTRSRKGVIRGIHFQREKKQAKIVRCVLGSIYDVVVDLRKDSPTFGSWQGFLLTSENKDELYIPNHCGHGFFALDESIVSYKCDEKYYSEFDDGIIWNDHDVAVQWSLGGIGEVILSDKDSGLQTLRQFNERYGGL